MSFPVEACRRQFPGLERRVAGRAAVFLDGPAGSQVPERVADAVSRVLLRSNANLGGAFESSRENDALMASAGRAVADFLGSADPDLVVFGPNMTTLTFALARSFAGMWEPQDEIVVTRLEHDANWTPWVQAAEAAGASVREIGIHREDCTLDLAELEAALGESTRLVAVCAASNLVGTVTPLRRIADMAHSAGALVFVDAVHWAPHRLIDVEAWEADFVVCSPYKFFGPHLGLLWGRRELLEGLPALKLRPAPEGVPGRWMPGTQSHEAIAGAMEAIDYLADLGRTLAGRPGLERRPAVRAAFDAIVAHEAELVRRLIEGLLGRPGVRVWGITDPVRADERTPTVAFTVEGRSPAAIARNLAERGVFVWSGNSYALPLTRALGLEPEGVVRAGLLHYNTPAEVDRLLEAL